MSRVEESQQTLRPQWPHSDLNNTFVAAIQFKREVEVCSLIIKINGRPRPRRRRGILVPAGRLTTTTTTTQQHMPYLLGEGID